MTKRTKTDDRHVQVTTDSVTLEGNLSIPDEPKGIVVFVHGSGSSRHSPRNQYVAQMFQEGGLATLLFDLLTMEEEQVDLFTRHLRFDINLLARRTTGAIDWIEKAADVQQSRPPQSPQPDIQNLSVGLFGSSTGAAAALIAAAERPKTVRAVVSRGGRPDLAGPALPKVQAPVMLIVGELDYVVIELNKQALAEMQPEPEKKLVIVPGATHLFEEPGTLEQAARLARDWFQKYLPGE